MFKILALLLICFSAVFLVQCDDQCKVSVSNKEMKCVNITSYYLPSEYFISYEYDFIGLTDGLNRLEITHSNITMLQNSSFKHLPSLTQILIPNSYIKHVDMRTFVSLSKLKWVDLSYNLISKLQPDTFTWSPVRHLNLEGNELLQIPTNGPLLNCNKLTWLNVKGSNIQHLSGSTFSLMQSLTHLDLSYNKLEMLPTEVFAPLQHLLFLDLSHNNFQYLDVKTFNTFFNSPITKTLHLESNPWECDCKLKPLIHSTTVGISPKGKKLVRLQGFVYCSGPIEQQNREWKYLNLDCPN